MIQGVSLSRSTFGAPKTPRSACDGFLQLLHESSSISSLPTAMVSKGANPIFQINRNSVVYLAVSNGETPPLATLELLLRVYTVLHRYFGYISEDVLRNNFSTIYLLLDEMIDAGSPAVCEANILEMLIPTGSMFDKAMQLVASPSAFFTDIARSIGLASPASALDNISPSTGLGSSSPTIAAFGGEGMGLGSGVGGGGGISGCGSDIWWRKGNVSHAGNEVYVDIVESINCIVDKSGNTLSAFVTGSIQISSKLSGIPDLTLNLRQTNLLDDAGLHPCVRLQRFERDRVLSFCPPDGEFELANYLVTDADPPSGFNNKHSALTHLTHSRPPPVLPSPTFTPPLSFTGRIDWNSSDVGAIELRVRPQMPVGLGGSPNNLVLEGVTVVMPLPSFISAATMTASTGTVRFIHKSKVLVWDVGKMFVDNQVDGHVADGTLSVVPKPHGHKSDSIVPAEAAFVAQLNFTLKAWTVSSLKVDSLEIHGVNYSPYKGVRYSTTSGKMEYRVN